MDDRGPHSIVVPYMYAAVDPQAKWWERLRGNPKRLGEISQAAFLLKAEMMGYHLALPWGDSERWDFIVWGRDAARAVRVQVKGTGRLDRGGYDVQPVHSTRRAGKKRYTKKDIDVIAAHVQPEDAWYLIPIEAVGRAKSLRLCPQRESGDPTLRQAHGRILRSRLRAGHSQSIESQNPHPVANAATRMGQPRRVKDWEQWRDAWELLGER